MRRDSAVSIGVDAALTGRAVAAERRGWFMVRAVFEEAAQPAATLGVQDAGLLSLYDFQPRSSDLRHSWRNVSDQRWKD